MDKNISPDCCVNCVHLKADSVFMGNVYYSCPNKPNREVYSFELKSYCCDSHKRVTK